MSQLDFSLEHGFKKPQDSVSQAQSDTVDGHGAQRPRCEVTRDEAHLSGGWCTDLCVQPSAPEAFRQRRRITAEMVVQQDLCRTLPGGASSHSPTTTPPALGSASNKGKKARLMELVKRAKWAETSPQVLTLDGQRWGAGTVSSLKSTL